MTVRVVSAFVVMGLLCGAFPRATLAGVIEYEAIDALDLVPGADLWVYRYTVTGFHFDANQGFAISFAPDRYADLAQIGLPNADWDELIVQPDTVLLADGFLDELALVDDASLAGSFDVLFMWIGGPARPGSQPYELYELDGLGNLRVVAEGRTVGRVPEPTSLVLLLSAAATAVMVRRRFTT